MIIKKFQGKTEADATEQAKKELGPNVVIMNVKNVKKKGFLGFMKRSITEVTAAVEEENERIPYTKKEEKTRRTGIPNPLEYLLVKMLMKTNRDPTINIPSTFKSDISILKLTSPF